MHETVLLIKKAIIMIFIHQSLRLTNCIHNILEYIIVARANNIYPTPPLGQDMTQGQFF